MFLRPSEREEGPASRSRSHAPQSHSHGRRGHSHLGDVQGVLGDVVLQPRSIAVASRPECQVPGRAHGAVDLDVTEALQDLEGGRAQGEAQGPVSDPEGRPSLLPALQASYIRHRKEGLPGKTG